MAAAEPCPWLGLLPAHALGALDDGDRRALEEHLLAPCRQCEAELAELRRDVEALAQAMPAVAPPPSTREWLMDQAHGPRRALRRGRLVATALAAAAAALIFGAGWWGAHLTGEVERLEAERERLAGVLAAVEQRLERAEGERAALVRQLGLLAGPRFEQVQLAALRDGGPASGRAFVDRPGGRALFYTAGLPQLRAGQTYQLWLIASGRPVPAGTFEVGAGGHGRLVLEGLVLPDRIDAWAVTVEPAGGVPQPTGEMVLRG
jgi:anti-sigma-K factor RskA